MQMISNTRLSGKYCHADLKRVCREPKACASARSAFTARHVTKINKMSSASKPVTQLSLIAGHAVTSWLNVA